MHDIINFLKGAVLRGDAQKNIMSSYHFGHELVTARNESLQAGIYMESPISFVAPAAELEAVLSRIKAVSAVNLADNTLTLKGGRVKASISCIVDEPLTLQQIDAPWVPSPAGLVEALKLALPFVSDVGWNAGIRVRGDKLTAIKNIGGIDVTVLGLACDCDITIPVGAAEFIVGQGDPAEYTIDKGCLVVRWGDGRWLRAQLLAATFPDSIDGLFECAAKRDDQLIELTTEWREAWEDAAALSEGSVELSATCLRGVKGLARSEVQIETLVGDDHVSRWSIKMLAPVLAAATHWAPQMFPDPVLFTGPNLRGIVVGLR